MTEHSPEELPPEAAVLSALGLDPSKIQGGSFKIIYDGQGDPIVTWITLQRVPTLQLARALTIASTPAFTAAPDKGDSESGAADPAAEKGPRERVADLAQRRRDQRAATAVQADVSRETSDPAPDAGREMLADEAPEADPDADVSRETSDGEDA